jgi:hypothetical protein
MHTCHDHLGFMKIHHRINLFELSCSIGLPLPMFCISSHLYFFCISMLSGVNDRCYMTRSQVTG